MKVVLMLLYYIILPLNPSSTLRVDKTRGHVDKGRIIGGSDAAIGEFPFMAAINVTTTSRRFFCGGALANNRWVVTSGTCVYDVTLFTILLGSIHLNGPDAHIFGTSSYELHPDFDPDTLNGDVGLIRTNMWINDTDFIMSAITNPSVMPPDIKALSLGRGHTSDSDSALSNGLKYVHVTVLPNEICRAYYGNQVTENMMCIVGNDNEGTCIGDTGGPLTYSRFNVYWIIGISSFISGNGCESTEPSGFTRIEPYLRWIDGHLYSESIL